MAFPADMLQSEPVMKLISWNVNGLRAVLGKGFMDFFNSQDADVFCLQEIKLSEGQLDLDLPGYHCYWNYAQKKGYSGTAVFSKKEPLSVIRGKDDEGRICALEFEDFFVVDVYTPNSQDGLARLPFRLEWDGWFRSFVCDLDSRKPVLICGDLNVAHKEIDIKNPKANLRNAGFTIEERDSFTKLLECGFTREEADIVLDYLNRFDFTQSRNDLVRGSAINKV